MELKYLWNPILFSCVVGWVISAFSWLGPFQPSVRMSLDVAGEVKVLTERQFWELRGLDLVLALPPQAVWPQASATTFLSYAAWSLSSPLALASCFHSKATGGHSLSLVAGTWIESSDNAH